MVVLAALAGALVLGSIVYLLRSPELPTDTEAGPAATPAQPAQTEARADETEARPSSGNPVLDGIDNIFARLQSGQASDADLDALRRDLLNADPAQATAAIRAFLESGKDIPTRQEFMIGEGGVLASAPTMRTLLLDVLGQISKKTGSDAAAVISREVLQTKESPDEWAVAMRNVAWHDPKSKPYLAGKVREMLAHEPWKLQPSAGFLESFDVVVYSEDPTFVPDMANLLRGENEELRRASAVALDRLSAMAPLEVMNYLNANPNELADRPFLRADYYAKANLADPAQLQALEAYLSRGDVSVPEKTKLLKALATPASFVSENLLTVSTAPEDDSVVRDQQLSQTFDQWIKQGRFPQLQGTMQQIQGQLGM